MTVKISGNSSASTPSFAGDDGDSGLHATADQVQLVTNGTVGVTVDSSQRVGIGETSPGANLHVKSSGATEIRSDSTGDNALVAIQNSSAIPWIITQRADTSNALSFRRSGNNYVNIDTSGNVGIGTTSPQTLLDLESNTPIIRFTDANATGTPECDVSGAGGNLTFAADLNNAKSDSTIKFQIDGSEKARILAGGGLTFNGDTSTNNALDDYEEGTWTPSFSGFSAINYTAQTGAYVKVGRLVYVYGRLAYSSRTASNNVAIQGLPFNRDISVLANASADIRIYFGGGARNHALAYSTTNGYYPCTEGQGSASNDPFGSSANIYFHMTYTASS
jgi:hypothetical protein